MANQGRVEENLQFATLQEFIESSVETRDFFESLFPEDSLAREYFNTLPPILCLFLFKYAWSYDTIKSVCQDIGMSQARHRSAYKDMPRYRQLFDRVKEWHVMQMAADLETSLLDRALNGVEKPVTFQGMITDTYMEYDNKLGQWLLEHHHPRYAKRDKDGNAIINEQYIQGHDNGLLTGTPPVVEDNTGSEPPAAGDESQEEGDLSGVTVFHSDQAEFVKAANDLADMAASMQSDVTRRIPSRPEPPEEIKREQEKADHDHTGD